nr:MAG TPA: hypothetical protein [Caudoviricetes sp.]
MCISPFPFNRTESVPRYRQTCHTAVRKIGRSAIHFYKTR